MNLERTLHLNAQPTVEQRAFLEDSEILAIVPAEISRMNTGRIATIEMHSSF
jgi:hypothetical protein